MKSTKPKRNKLVVADSGWAETLPKWILEEIKEERLIYGLADVRNQTETVGDAEVVAYLYTLSLRQHLSHELVEIYFYLSAKLTQKCQYCKSKNMPEFLTTKLEQGLTAYEQRELNGLKAELYRKRGGEIEDPVLNAMRGLKPKSTERR